MEVNPCFIDIETVPDQSLPEECKPPAPLGNATKPETIARKEAEWKETGQLKKMATSPDTNMIVDIEILEPHGNDEPGDFISFIGEETFLLSEFWEWMNKKSDPLNPLLLVGFHLYGFDWQTILKRTMLLGIPVNMNIPTFAKFSSFPFYDCAMVLANWDIQNIKGKTLDWWCKRLRIAGKSGNGSQVYDWWKDGDIKTIQSYCQDDVVATEMVFNKISKYYKPTDPRGGIYGL